MPLRAFIPVINLQPALRSVLLCHRYRIGVGIQAGHGGSEPCQRLTNKPTAAANIDNTQPLQRFQIRIFPSIGLANLRLNIGHPHRVQPMQRLKRPVLIPPMRRIFGKLLNFFFVDCINHHEIIIVSSRAESRDLYIKPDKKIPLLVITRSV